MRSLPGKLVEIVMAATLLVSCGGKARPGPTSSPGSNGDLEAAIAELSFVVASDPSDSRAHAALAELQLEAGRPGAALHHYEVAFRNRGLEQRQYEIVARLYLQRAEVRLTLGHGDVEEDLEAARQLAPNLEISTDLWRRAGLAAALSELRRGRLDQANKAIKRALARAAGVELAALDPAGANLEDLAAAAVWVYDGGAKRAGLRLLEQYVDRGGRAPAPLRRYLAGRRWWGGTSNRPGLLLLDEVAAAGVSLCLVATTPTELGCGRSLLEIARSDPALAREIDRRAARLHWRTAVADQAAAWTIMTLAGWLAGEADSWLGGLTRRVDVDQLTARYRPEELPGFAAATLLRAAGQLKQAAAALDRAIAAAATFAPAERAVVIAEAAIVGRDQALIRQLANSGELGVAGWLAAMRAARSRGWKEFAAELIRRPPADGSAVAEFLRRSGDLGLLVGLDDRAPAAVAADRHRFARWSRSLTNTSLVSARDSLVAEWAELAGGSWKPAAGYVGLGVPDPLQLAEELGVGDELPLAEMAELVTAYLREPATADRLAERFVAGAVAIGQRGPLVAELFNRLGDPARALRWWERIAASSPHHPAYLQALGEAAAAIGDFARADVHFLAAAAASGDPGASNRDAAVAIFAAGGEVAALIAARRALHLTAKDDQRELLELVVTANLALGRQTDAEAAREAQIALVPAEFRDAATGGWLGRRDRLLATANRDAEVYLADVGIAIARAEALGAAGDRDAARTILATAVAWNPDSVAGRAAYLALLPPESSEYRRQLVELLLLGVAGPPEVAIPALEQVAGRVDRPNPGQAIVDELRWRRR